MLLLGFDTATAVTTVALVRSGADGTDGVDRVDTVDTVLAERSHRDARRHGEVLPVQIDAVLSDADVRLSDVDAIAVGIGPGAFTGLRVGLATADALGLALAVPVHGANTLDVLAFATQRDDPFAIVTDARRREYFWSTYSSFDTCTSQPAVGTPDAARSALTGLDVVAPPGTPAIDGLHTHAGAAPSGSALCVLVLSRLAQERGTDRPEPMYLRRPDVMPSSAPKSVLS